MLRKARPEREETQLAASEGSERKGDVTPVGRTFTLLGRPQEGSGSHLEFGLTLGRVPEAVAA